MLPNRPFRVLYVLNHKTATPFEVELLRNLGFEVLVPKTVPTDETTYRSASAFWQWDDDLTLSREILGLLNRQDFYGSLLPEIKEVISREFDIVFLIASPELLVDYLSFFPGVLMVRVYGHSNDIRYTDIYKNRLGPNFFAKMGAVENRFFFTQIFEQICSVEGEFFRNTALTLPLGLPKQFFDTGKTWTGGSDNVLFVAPDMLNIPYYKDIYDRFRSDFHGFSYKVLGIQPIRPPDPNVLGFQAEADFREVMRTAAAYVYPSDEERHLHYTPVEAMVQGMPVLFKECGALGRFFPSRAPGAYGSIDEARAKLARLVNRDQALISEILHSQEEVIIKMRPEWSEARWRDEFEAHIFPVLERLRTAEGLADAKASLLPFAQQVPPTATGFDWEDSFDFGNRLKIDGAKSEAKLAKMAEACFEGIDLQGATCVAVTSGEGAYCLYLVNHGAKHVVSIPADWDHWTKSKLVRNALEISKWDIEQPNLQHLCAQIAATAGQLQGVDWFLFQGITNLIPDLAESLTTAFFLARGGLVVELDLRSFSERISREGEMAYNEGGAGIAARALGEKMIADVFANILGYRIDLLPSHPLFPHLQIVRVVRRGGVVRNDDSLSVIKRIARKLLPNADFRSVRSGHIRLDAESFPGEVGTVMDGKAFGEERSVRVMTGGEIAGGFLGGLRFKGVSGRYNLILRLIAESGSSHPVAYAEVGVFQPDFRSIVKRELECIKGGRIRVSLSFEIDQSQEGWIHEIRLFSLGVAGLIFLGGDLVLKKPL